MGAYIQRLTPRDADDLREKVISLTWNSHSLHCGCSRAKAVEMAVSGQT